MEWKLKKEASKKTYKYVYDKQSLQSLDENVYDSVLGLFAHDHMPYHLESTSADPTLSEMTEKAIQMLKKKNNGFFLFVEGKFLFLVIFAQF